MGHGHPRNTPAKHGAFVAPATREGGNGVQSRTCHQNCQAHVIINRRTPASSDFAQNRTRPRKRIGIGRYAKVKGFAKFANAWLTLASLFSACLVFSIPRVQHGSSRHGRFSAWLVSAWLIFGMDRFRRFSADDDGIDRQATPSVQAPELVSLGVVLGRQPDVTMHANGAPKPTRKGHQKRVDAILLPRVGAAAREALPVPCCEDPLARNRDVDESPLPGRRLEREPAQTSTARALQETPVPRCLGPFVTCTVRSALQIWIAPANGGKKKKQMIGE